jgi:beta-lactamase class A
MIKGKWTAVNLRQAYDSYYHTGKNSAAISSIGEFTANLYRGKYLSESGTKHAIQVMRECKTGKRRLRARIPDDVAFVHKTGTQYRRACDVGVMEFKPGPVVVAACLRNFDSLTKAERTMASIGEAVFEVLGKSTATTEQQ